MFKNLGIATKSVVPGVLVALVVSVVAYFLIADQARQLAIRDAKKTAEAISNQVAADRQIYTSEVVGKLRRDGLEILPSNQASYRSVRGGIPLPASFVHSTSDVVNSGEDKTHTIDLLSLWNINQVKGARSQWEEQALRKVADQPGLVEIGVLGEGLETRLSAVSADVASASACVSCHNNHPESPKKDFRMGDVMGGLVVSIPMAEEFQQAHENGLKLTFLLAGGFVVLLLLQWLLVNRRLVRNIGDLQKAAERISLGELDAPVTSPGNDEVGRLAEAFERMRISLREAMKQL